MANTTILSILSTQDTNHFLVIQIQQNSVSVNYGTHINDVTQEIDNAKEITDAATFIT